MNRGEDSTWNRHDATEESLPTQHMEEEAMVVLKEASYAAASIGNFVIQEQLKLMESDRGDVGENGGSNLALSQLLEMTRDGEKSVPDIPDGRMDSLVETCSSEGNTEEGQNQKADDTKPSACSVPAPLSSVHSAAKDHDKQDDDENDDDNEDSKRENCHEPPGSSRLFAGPNSPVRQLDAAADANADASIPLAVPSCAVHETAAVVHSSRQNQEQSSFGEEDTPKKRLRRMLSTLAEIRWLQQFLFSQMDESK